MDLRAGLRSRFAEHALTLQKFIQGVILISLVAMTLATMESLSPPVRRALAIIELITLVIFVIEYAVRIIVAENRLKYLFSVWGIIDFMAIVPSLLLPGMDLKALRALRFLRLVRILKLARYSTALNTLARGFASIRAELAVFFTLAAIVFFIAACGIYLFEHEAQPDKFPSIPASMWWAIATLTTVGYGDVYPVTAGGKVFTFLVLMVGLGLVSIPTGLLASSLTQAREEERKADDAGTDTEAGKDL